MAKVVLKKQFQNNFLICSTTRFMASFMSPFLSQPRPNAPLQEATGTDKQKLFFLQGRQFADTYVTNHL